MKIKMATGFGKSQSRRGRQIKPTPKMQELLNMQQDLSDMIKETELSITRAEASIRDCLNKSIRHQTVHVQRPEVPKMTSHAHMTLTEYLPTSQGRTVEHQPGLTQQTMPVQHQPAPARLSMRANQTVPEDQRTTFRQQPLLSPYESAPVMPTMPSAPTLRPISILQHVTSTPYQSENPPHAIPRFSNPDVLGRQQYTQVEPTQQITTRVHSGSSAIYDHTHGADLTHSPNFHMNQRTGYLQVPQESKIYESSYYPPPRNVTQAPELHNSDHQTEEHALLYRLADLLTNKQERLPKMEPDVFSGDLMQFPSWLNSFEALIERNTGVASDRLFFLGKYTAGDARACIHGYLTLYTDDAYAQAKSILLARYGDKVKVAQAYKKKLNEWPQVKPHDGFGLQKYSDFLWQCNAAMHTIDYLSTLESVEENERLVRKLPQYAAERWKRLVDKSLYNTEQTEYGFPIQSTGRYPSFYDFCKFVADEARVACGPCSTRALPESKSPTKFNSGTRGRVRSLSTQSKEQTTETPASNDRGRPKTTSTKGPPQCLFCKAAHHISSCATFLEQKVEDKKAFALKHGLCFGCLRRQHLYRDCKNRNPSLMAAKKTETDKKYTDGENKGKLDCEVDTVMSHKITTSSKQGVLHTMILPVMLSYKDNPQQILTYAILDNMSDACFVKADLVKKLKANTLPVELEVTTLVDKKVVKTETVQDLKIKGLKEPTVVQMPKTYCREDISTDRNLIPRHELIQNWPHLKSVARELHPYQADLDVGILIGASCSSAMMPKEVIAEGDNDPYAMRTCLGWGVVGWVERPLHMDERDNTHFVYKTSTREVSPSDVKKMFDLEFSEHVQGQKMSAEDKQFMNTAHDGIHQRTDGHFEMPLPLKQKHIKLPNNRAMAEKRLNQLKVKMTKNDKYKQEYTTTMTEVIQKGYAELVPKSELPGKPGQVWYIPHHGVYHPKKKKLRVVYDCSAEYAGEVLNHQLLSGPDLTNSIIGILCRFREEPVAISCDIEGMFHQVGVNPEHRDLLRFLWWPNGDLNTEPKDYRMAVHLFGATSSPACANYALRATADAYEEVYGTEAANFVRRNFYVDDGLQSAASPEDAVKLIQTSRDLCQAGGFKLHKFVCNNKDVLEQIPHDVKAKDIQGIDIRLDPLPVERTLGIEWCLESDTFLYRVMQVHKPFTRRGILSCLSSIYDPLGLVSPFLLEGKKILQAVCKDGKDWDDPVEETVEAQWKHWLNDLQNLAGLNIPRCYKPTKFGALTDVQLHHFSDACQDGYGQCSYLRLVDDQSNVATSLVMAKARVAPLKAITIPRLELTAAVTSVKIGELLNSELEYGEIKNVYWTDSQVVLGYIANQTRRFHIYVANRVQQIHDRTNVQDWHFVRTKDNPADLASRGISAQVLIQSHLWWKGPAFLSNSNLTLTQECHPVYVDDPELKKSVVHSTTTEPKYADLVERLEYFSDWHRARKSVALCRRYITILKNKCFNIGQQVLKGHIHFSVSEIDDAERVIIRALQKKSISACYSILMDKVYPAERDLAKQRRATLRGDTNLYRLDPYMGKDALIRVGGRIRRADIPRELAHPIILPGGHITQLIVEYFHKKSNHSGKDTTLSEIRAAGYWILRARTVVNHVIHHCVTCRRLRFPPGRQKMADLPADRMEIAPAFTYVGADLFGPFYIKEGRSEKKRWGCLFTCLVTRAIHIEVVTNLSTDSFLNAYRRFIGRRGATRVLRSDRGTNFVGAKGEQQSAFNEMDQDTIRKELLKNNCDWINFQMNPPLASHMGGVWERMIRSATGALTNLLAQHASSLDDELLRTLMTEAEAIVNSRPLTYVDADSEPLTPSQLLTMKTKVVMPPPGHFVKEDLYCRKRWRRVQYLANLFWTRWRNEFLSTLQSRQKWHRPQANLQIGDIVLLVDDAAPRCQWSKAVVSHVHPGDDGLVRKVTVRTATSEYDRSITKMVLLYRPGIPTEEPYNK